MTSAAQIASKVARGYGIGALKLGRTTTICTITGTTVSGDVVSFAATPF